FNIKKPPLMRVALIRLDGARHIAVWTRHHLTVDGWSLGIILDEVFALYKSARSGQPHGLLPAPAFRAYVDWERQADRSGVSAYWRAALADDPAGEGRLRATRRLNDAGEPDIRSDTVLL